MVKVDLKVTLVGYTSVGKTTLTNRFLNGIFDETLPAQMTMGFLFNTKIVEVDGKKLNMGIWDSGGEVRWEDQVAKSCKDANAVIVCYNCSEMESFKRVRFWLRELNNSPYSPEERRIYVCATKSDLLHTLIQATPDLTAVENYAKAMKAKFFLTSSKTGENIVEMFEEIARDYLSNTEHVEKLEKLKQMEIEEPVYYQRGRKMSSQPDHVNCGCFSWFYNCFRSLFY